MYCCTATQPDLAYAVHQHCRALSRPTPELISELKIAFAYLKSTTFSWFDLRSRPSSRTQRLLRFKLLIGPLYLWVGYLLAKCPACMGLFL